MAVLLLKYYSPPYVMSSNHIEVALQQQSEPWDAKVWIAQREKQMRNKTKDPEDQGGWWGQVK